jgi:hypothetical protein
VCFGVGWASPPSERLPEGLQTGRTKGRGSPPYLQQKYIYLSWLDRHCIAYPSQTLFRQSTGYSEIEGLWGTFK